jgi:mono/diheme cytochrome c family protein
MTRNLTIATIFLLASTLLLGYIWVRENYVLRDREQRFQGALVARGASEYEQYCANCHGLTGEGGVNAGAPQLNNMPVTLQEQDRLDGPNGITAKYGTIRNFVEATITSGVKGTAMPRWSSRLGGPLRDDQIKNLAAYIQSWWPAEGGTNPNIPAEAVEVANSYKQSVQATAAAQAVGDTPQARGAALFSSTGCNACHNQTDRDSAIPAPGLGGLFSPEGTAAWGTILPSGLEVSPENVKEWIRGGSAGHTNPRPPVNSGFGPYSPLMPAYPQLNDEQLNDLVAFLSTLDRTGQPTQPPLGPDGQPLPAQEGQPVTSPEGTPVPTQAAQPNAAPEDPAAPTTTP